MMKNNKKVVRIIAIICIIAMFGTIAISVFSGLLTHI